MAGFLCLSCVLERKLCYQTDTYQKEVYQIVWLIASWSAGTWNNLLRNELQMYISLLQIFLADLEFYAKEIFWHLFTKK